MAPEPAISSWLRSVAGHYISADLYKEADAREDLTALTFPAAIFDVMWCSHVLEHIADDAAAMSEMHRVLRSDALAMVQVPVKGLTTEEDLSIRDPAERTRRFGQPDHLRLYGLDIVDRLAAAGFDVTVIDSADLDRGDVTTLGLEYVSTRHIFICRPRAS